MKNRKNKQQKAQKPKEYPLSRFSAISIRCELSNKPNLPDDEKNLLERATKFLYEDNKRIEEGNKRLNRDLGLPEDTPIEITLEALKQRTKEAKELVRKANRESRKINARTEQMKEELWTEIKRDAEEFKKKHPEIKDWTVGKVPMKPEENLELPPCNCHKKCNNPFKKMPKNKLLGMPTG
ncbi:MAG: hypothetical protein WCE94_09595 [Candidatus Methanoperedens sp.]